MIQRLCRLGLAGEERGPAVCGCGFPAQDMAAVDIHLRPDRRHGVRAGVSKIRRCKSGHLCPTCAAAVTAKRAERVQHATDAVFSRGGAVALVVLTASHGRTTSLADIKGLVSAASTGSREGRAWDRLAEEHALAGVIVGPEVTVSRAHGWHYHQHLAVLVDGEPTDDASSSFEDVDLGTAFDARNADFVGPLRPCEVVDRARAGRLAEAIRLAVGRGKGRFGPPTRAAVLARLPDGLDPIAFERDEARRLLDIGSAALPAARRVGPPTRKESEAIRVMRACRRAVGSGMGPPASDAVVTQLCRMAAQTRAEAIGRLISDRYKAAIRAAGGKVSDEHGTYVRIASDSEDASGYTSKGSMAWEVSGGHKDLTKADTSMTPWDLARAAYDGDPWARARWAEYVEGMKGVRSCVISKSMAQRLEILPSADEPPSDQDFAEEDGRIGSVASAVWRTLKREALVGTFLGRLEFDAADKLKGRTPTAEAIQEAGRAVLPSLIAWAIDVTREADERAEARRQARRRREEKERADAVARERDAFQQYAIRQAIHRLGDISRYGAGTRDRLARACADVEAMCPGMAPPTPSELLTAAMRQAA